MLLMIFVMLLMIFVAFLLPLLTIGVWIPSVMRNYKEITEEVIVGKELVPGKPSVAFRVSETTPLLQQNSAVGDINPSACVYIDSSAGKKPVSVFLYAWVWSKSFSTNAARDVVLTQNENIRVAPNLRIIGRLRTGAKGRLIHTNSKGSWGLLRFEGTVQPQKLTSNGGEYADDIMPEIYIMVRIMKLILEHKVFSALVLALVLMLIIIHFLHVITGSVPVANPKPLTQVDTEQVPYDRLEKEGEAEQEDPPGEVKAPGA